MENSVKERVAKHEAQIEMILEKLDRIERKLDELVYVTVQTRALEDRIEHLSSEVAELREELSRVYSLYRWVVGLVATGFAGMIAVLVSLAH